MPDDPTVPGPAASAPGEAPAREIPSGATAPSIPPGSGRTGTPEPKLSHTRRLVIGCAIGVAAALTLGLGSGLAGMAGMGGDGSSSTPASPPAATAPATPGAPVQAPSSAAPAPTEAAPSGAVINTSVDTSSRSGGTTSEDITVSIKLQNLPVTGPVSLQLERNGGAGAFTVQSATATVDSNSGQSSPSVQVVGSILDLQDVNAPSGSQITLRAKVSYTGAPGTIGVGSITIHQLAAGSNPTVQEPGASSGVSTPGS